MPLTSHEILAVFERDLRQLRRDLIAAVLVEFDSFDREAARLLRLAARVEAGTRGNGGQGRPPTDLDGDEARA